MNNIYAQNLAFLFLCPIFSRLSSSISGGPSCSSSFPGTSRQRVVSFLLRVLVVLWYNWCNCVFLQNKDTKKGNLFYDDLFHVLRSLQNMSDFIHLLESSSSIDFCTWSKVYSWYLRKWSLAYNLVLHSSCRTS